MSARPTVSRGVVYCADLSGGVAAVFIEREPSATADADTRGARTQSRVRVLWEYDARAPVFTSPALWSVAAASSALNASSAATAPSVLIGCVDGSVHCLSEGQQVWRTFLPKLQPVYVRARV